MTKKTDEVLGGLMVAGVVVLIIGACLIQPYMEMRSFNKFSDTKANIADAIFSKLRVQSN